jgi:hypothetical protein
MTKKYLPFIVLIGAALLLFYVKKNQRGSFPVNPNTEISIPVITGEAFNRNAQKIIYSKHARCRMECRHIDESEVLEILKTGKINEAKIEEDSRGKTYPLEGKTHDNQNVRIVFAQKQEEMVVVTVIDLDKEWACDCGNK